MKEPATTEAPPPAAALRVKAAEAERFFAALGNPLRWQMVRLLAERGPLAASHFARELHRDVDNLSKHLRVLQRGGVVRDMVWGDRRCVWFFIPKATQPEPGVLDYGAVRVDLRPAPPAS